MKRIFLAYLFIFSALNFVDVRAADSGISLFLKDGHLGLTVEFKNPLSETVSVYYPSGENPSDSGAIWVGDLTLQVFSPDNVDRSAEVFNTPRPAVRWGSLFGTELEPGARDAINYTFSDKMSAKLEALSGRGWKLKVRLVGFTNSHPKICIVPDKAYMGDPKYRPGPGTTLFEATIDLIVPPPSHK